MKKITLLLLSAIFLSGFSFSQISSAGLYFDGVYPNDNNYATVPHNSVYDIGTGDFTVEVWVRVETYHAVGSYFFRKKILASGGAGIDLFYVNAGFLYLNMGSSQYSSQIALTPNTCHHVAVVKSGTTARFYKDGNLISTSTVSLININTTEPIYIGGGVSLGSMGGFIHEVRFWNIARSQASIQSTMNSMLSGTESGLIGYWKLNEGTGQIINDSSPTLNHGYLGASASTDSNDPEFQTGCSSCAPINAVITASGPTTFCSPGSVTLTASGGTTYSWRITNGWLGAPYTNTRTVANSGTYQCAVGNGCDHVISNPITVTVNPSPTVTISSSNNGFCSSAPSVLTASTGSGNTLQWYFNNSPISGATTNTYTASQVGAYYCRATNAACGSLNSNVFNYWGNAPAVPVITPSGTLNNCTTAYPVTLTVNPPSNLSSFSNTWYRNGLVYSSFGGSSIQVNSPGHYYATVSYTCGGPIQSSNSLDLKVLPAPSIPVEAHPQYGSYGCPGMGIYVMVNDFFFWNSYQWQKDSVDIPGATGWSYYPSVSGNYRCLVANSCTTQYTDNRIVDIVSATITPSGSTTYCYGNPITLTGPTPPAGSGHTYNYTWHRSDMGANVLSTSQTITTTTPGTGTYTYTLHVNASYGCSCCIPSSSITINVLGPVATISAIGPTTVCAPATVTLNNNLTGQGYTYQWRLNNVDIPGATSVSYAASATGSYTCNVNTGTCNPTSNAISVTVGLPPPATITASGPTSFCSAVSPVTLSANTGAGLSYQWQLNGGPIAGATTSSYVAAAIGNYECIITNSCGSSTSNAIAITVVSPFTATITAADPTTFCYGGNVTLNASPTGSGYTYQWRNYGFDIAGATASSFIANTSGDYDVVISNTCVATSNIITVTITNFFVSTLRPDGAAGNDAVIGSLSSQANVNYGTSAELNALAWTVNAVPANQRSLIQFDLGAIPVNAVVQQATLSLYNNPNSSNGNPAGSHSSLSGSNAAWLQKVTSPWSESTVTWNTQPTTNITNQAVLPQSTGAHQDYSIDVTVLVQDMVNNPASNYGFMLRLQTEAYYRVLVFASSDYSDSTKRPALLVAYYIPLSASITAAGSTTFCSPGSVTLNANTGPGLTYQWQLNSSPILGATSSSYSATGTGNYDCIVSNSCSSATSNSIAVTVNSPPLAAITPAGPTTFCFPGSVTLNANTGPGLSYQWRMNGVDIAGEISSSLVTTTGGNFDCVVTNSCGNVVSNVITVTEDVLPLAAASAAGPTTFCSPGSVTLNVSTCTGCTYQWRQNSAAIPSATASSYAATPAGNYDCLVTNTCGTRTSNTITVATDVAPAASITAASPTTVCSPNSVMLNANTGAGLSYQWRLNGGTISGATSSSYNATATGNYDCVVSNTCGSISSNVIGVTVSPLPTAVITAAGPTTVCSPNSVTLNANTGPGLSYQWRLNGGDIASATASSYNAASNGNYDCVVTNLCGSITSNVISVTVAFVPATPGSITGQATGVCSSTRTYSISAVVSATSYVWTVPAGASISNGQGTTSVNVAFTNSFGNGSVSVAATNSCGSSSASSLAVTGVPAQPGTITGPASVCHNQNNVIYSIAAVTGASSYTWTVPPGTQIKNGQGTIQIRVRFGNSAGNITVRANNSCGQSPLRTLVIAMPCKEEVSDNDFDVMLYPNPATDKLNVICYTLYGNETIKIFNDVGETILKSGIRNQESGIDISTFPAGIYFAEIISGEQKKVLKFIKQE